MPGRHAAMPPAADAETTPMPPVRRADPADLEHWEVLWRKAYVAVPDQLDRPGLIERLWVRLWPGQRKKTARLAAEAEAWTQAWRSGGTRAERQLRKTMRERGLLLVRRAGRRARRLRAALARKEWS